MADYEKSIGRATLAIPLIHVVTCGLYIAGYSAGFGGNIGGMFTASDFFTITIQHLLTTYVLSLALPISYIFVRHRSGKTYAVDLIAAEDDPERKAEMIATRQWIVKFSTWALPLIAVVPVSSFILQIWTDARLEYYLTLTSVSLALLPLWWTFANRLNFHGLPVELAWCVFVFIVGVLGLGLNSGERDRRLAYGDLAKGRMFCGSHVIVARLASDLFLLRPTIDGI